MPTKDKEKRRLEQQKWVRSNPHYSRDWLRKHPGYNKKYTKKFLKKNPNYMKNYRNLYNKDNYVKDYKKDKETGAEQARWVVKNLINAGKLISLAKNYVKCSDCNNRAIQYDHRDYNKPSEVEPVCQSCNLLRGKAISKIAGG